MHVATTAWHLVPAVVGWSAVGSAVDAISQRNTQASCCRHDWWHEPHWTTVALLCRWIHRRAGGSHTLQSLDFALVNGNRPPSFHSPGASASSIRLPRIRQATKGSALPALLPRGSGSSSVLVPLGGDNCAT